MDYALLGERGDLLQNPYHYRDRRTEGVMEEVLARVGRVEIYSGDRHSVHAHQYSVSTSRCPQTKPQPSWGYLGMSLGMAMVLGYTPRSER